MTEPTNEEIDALVAAYLGDCGPQATRVYSFARAVLAKWGTPAVAGGPVAWRYQDARGHYRYRGYVPRFDKDYALLKPIPLYATPQLTQAQAGAVPMTDEQISLLRFATSSLFHLFERRNNKEIPHCQLMDELGQVVEHVIRRTVAAHGIKGGQHGADT